MGIIVDLFAGGGGASVGIEAATNRRVDVAINHDPVALAVHCANHPRTRHLEADIWEVKPRAAIGSQKVDLLWASPDCTDFSNAKGGKPRDHGNRSLAWVVVEWAKAVRPSVICIENVPEFRGWCPLDEDGKRIESRLGETFDKWVRALERLGYVVEHRVIDASELGAPTRRRRLFIVARCDGLPIVWPAPTHGEGLLPFHTAAECIDWSLPCPSIFERARPLADKTQWRIAQGLRRFVFDNPRPFIVKVNHGKRDPRVESIDEPLTTVTAARRSHALVAPVLVQSGYGERKGQRARTLNIEAPLGTMVDGQKHALVMAFLARHFGERQGGFAGGVKVDGPLPSVTTRDHNAVVAATLVNLKGQCNGADVDEPMPTVTAGGNHVAEVRAFLTCYYGNDEGQRVDEPMRTLTTKHRLGLVLVRGIWRQVADIGMRMLQPSELLRGQFGRFASGYDLSMAETKEDQVRLIGNSVPPEVVEQLVRCNLPLELLRAA